MKRTTGETITVDAEPRGASPRPASRMPELADVELPSRFTPTRVIGAGAMGYVVEARDESLGRDVAVKVIAAKRINDPKSRDRFLREARAIATLHHEHIVTIHDLDPRGRFIVMELVRGETLKERIARGAHGVAEARRIGRALLSALATAHAAGVTHRDVKPANVLLGGDGSVKLADFGVAATTDSELTATGEVIGTPAYMAPEQLRGHSDPRVDLYAAGATLFEVATGKRLHESSMRASDVVAKVKSSVADAGLAAAIERAVREDPRERFADADAFAKALDAKPRRRMSRIATGVVIAAAVVVAGTAIVTRSPSSPSSSELLARGVAALAGQDYAAAERQLRSAAEKHPEAHYHLAILAWWRSRPTEEVVQAIDAALAGGVDERLAAIARGLRLLVRLEYPRVVDTFTELAQRYPRDRDVLYGLFEAQFHAGYPARAAATYQLLRDLEPDFSLGRHHVLAYWIARKELDRAREVLRGATGEERVKWQARIDVAAGDHASAIGALERAASGRKGLQWELAATYAAAGRIDDAYTLTATLASDMRASAIPLLALALARDTTAGPRSIDALWKVATSAANVPPALHVSQRDAWVELATLIAIAGDAERARLALTNIPPDLETKMLEPAVARALLYGVTREREPLERLATSGFPEVAAIAEALLAEADGAESVAAWQRALEHDGSGRFRIVELVRLARARSASGDREGATAACAVAVEPLLFHWSWGAAIPACAAITARRTPP